MNLPKKLIFVLWIFLFAFASPIFANAKFDKEVSTAQKSKWHGFDKFTFKFEGKQAIFIAPSKPRSDNAWVMRPAFLDAFPNDDIELLKRGFYIAFLDLTHRYASNSAMKDADKFYEYAVEKCGLSKKLVSEGLSRGGAIVLAWANHDPSKFAGVYADAPVCDFFVWPGEKNKKLTAALMKEWGISTMENFRGNPLDNYKKFAQSGVPLLLIAGDSDTVVPYDSNGKLYVERFRKEGGKATVIIKKGCGHHPHGLSDPAPIVEFVEKAFANANK